MMYRFCVFTIALFWSFFAHAHHWVVDAYDENQRVTIEVLVEEFRFINPHPLITAKLLNAADGRFAEYVGKDELWTLEMDNKWELADLGFNSDTFKPGDRVIVIVDPSPYDRLALYVRALEHPEHGFIYVHNQRKLFYPPAADPAP